MLKPSPWRIVFALATSVCALLVAAWFSDSTSIVAGLASTYDIAPSILIKVREALHSIEGILTALGTIAIAIFTWTLWRSTHRLWEANLDQINLAREEFVSTHRPKLRVRQFALERPVAGSPLLVRFAIINIGETTAHWRNTAAEVALWNGRFWEAPGISQVAQPSNNPPVRSGERIQATIHSRFDVTAEQISAIENGSLTVCAVGEFAYADDLGTTRRTGFRRNYDVRTDVFAATANSEQEYED